MIIELRQELNLEFDSYIQGDVAKYSRVHILFDMDFED